MVDWTERSFDLAVDITKQVVTLATGLIALSITFLKDVADAESVGQVSVLAISWLAFLGSIVCGLGTLMTLAGHQAKPPQDRPSINARNVKIFAITQIALFGVGMALTVLTGVLIIRTQA